MFFVCLTLLIAMSVSARPVPCLEDSQCPKNFYCDLYSYVCRKCLNCKELNRSSLPAPLNAPDRCVKSDSYCGPCLPGWQSYKSYRGAKCAPEEAKIEQQQSFKQIYIWLAGTSVAAGFLIIVIFIRVFFCTKIQY